MLNGMRRMIENGCILHSVTVLPADPTEAKSARARRIGKRRTGDDKKKKPPGEPGRPTTRKKKKGETDDDKRRRLNRERQQRRRDRLKQERARR